MRELISRLLERHSSLVLAAGACVIVLAFFSLVFNGETRSGASARECLPGDSEKWIPSEGLTCISVRPAMLSGSYEEDFVSYQVPQANIPEHIERWQQFARGASNEHECVSGILNNSPRSWPRAADLEVVTALPPNMDQGCVWVTRDTGKFYVQVRWGR